MKPFLLCTDLDRTLISNGKQPKSPNALTRFKRLVSCKEVTLAYVTGRHKALIEQAIDDFGLPQPDFAIADVGATIYQVDSSVWRQWDEWDEQIAPSWHGFDHKQLIYLLGVFPSLRLQEKEKQQRHKLSFYVELETDTKSLLDEIDMRLKYANIMANLIWSIDEELRLGLLDILPINANKLHAIRFLMQQKGFDNKNTIFAGDSGNDNDVLMSDIPSVLVANADEQTRKLASDTDPGNVYLAQGDYLDMNGNYSAGIIEGIAHYRPDVDKWLRANAI